jgi:CHAP domain
MTDWWKQPYPQNPQPPAVQQPRWLYPPDIERYGASSDGPDVQAYKIAVQRLGRWDKDPDGFDQDFSNRFAHGEPGEHVPTTGIAGFQRQVGLDDTGTVGAKTFDALRRALIPEGLPCAGEPAFTDDALDLLNDRKWWQYPYEQAPPASSVPFPRSLYAPDWPGQPAPADGADVQAYKRAISRLGRWPWQAFSGAYTDDFAHGTTGNVGDTGVAGVQRQTPGLEDTGNLSHKLYDVLMRALVPPCLPHAHEPAFDGYAIELLKNANAHKPSGSAREQALDAAARQVGYAEGPNNDNKFGAWYGCNYQPWCAMFCTWCFETTGGSPSFAKGSYYAYVPYIVSDARAGRRGLSVTSAPIPGDLCCYDWSWDGTFDHVGMFSDGNASSWEAIEGNTSPSNSGSQSNGGGVYRRSRSAAQANVVFVRVAE